MNYYQHHIGDYAAATKGFSLIEDGIYMRLLWVYYRDEKPFPADMEKIAWLVGVHSKKERNLLALILAQFFVLQDDGWHNARADVEIAKYQETQGKAKAAADARWNGKKQADDAGNASAMQTQCAGNACAMPTNNHKPITNNQ